MKPSVFALAILVLSAAAPAGRAGGDPAPPRFAIYRVDLVEDDAGPQRPHGRRDPYALAATMSQEYFLACARPHETPILTEDDVIGFCWDSQRLTLTRGGAQRWNAEGGFEVPLTGLPLVVVLDGRPRYGAMLWNPLSSRGCRLPEIWCMSRDHRLRIMGRFVSADGDTILGANYDPEIRRVLAELGKLTDPCPE